jgi:hypothetical protein
MLAGIGAGNYAEEYRQIHDQMARLKECESKMGSGPFQDAIQHLPEEVSLDTLLKACRAFEELQKSIQIVAQCRAEIQSLQPVAP